MLEPNAEMIEFFAQHANLFDGIDTLPGFEETTDVIDYMNARVQGYSSPMLADVIPPADGSSSVRVVGD